MSEHTKTSKATKIVQRNLDGKPVKLIEMTEETMNPADYRRPIDRKPVNDNSNTFDGLKFFERQETKQNQIDEILAKGSLRDRFQNLTHISTIEKMLMYTKYQELVDAFKALDESILFLKSKQAPQFMTTIKASYPQYKSAFYKVLTVSPDSYQVEKMDNEKILQLDRSDIYINAPIKSHLDVDPRVQKFKQDLFNYIHLNGEFIPEFQMSKSKQVVDESKKQIITQIEKTQIKSEIKLNISSEPTLSNASKRLIEKLKQKKQIEIAETDHKAPKKQLIQVASLLHNYYLTRKVSNMFYDNVIKYAANSLKQQILEEEKLKSYIEQLIEIGGSWISLVPNEKGTILRMDKTIELPKIIKKIEEL